MSEAIEFGIGGNNKNFVAVLTESEKKAKEAGKKIAGELDKPGASGLKGKPKITRDLDSLAKDVSKVTSVSGALDMSLSKIGAGLKIGGAIAVVSAIGKGIYDASVNAVELDLAMQRINRSNIGGVSNRGLSELQSNLETIRQARIENQKEIAGISTNFFAAGKSTIGEALARTGAAFTGAEVLSPGEREDKLRKAEEEALRRVGKKQEEIFSLEKLRISGAKEEAQILAIQLEYQEKIQAAIAVRNVDLQAQLKLERDALVAAAQRQQGVSLAQRVTREANAAMGAGDAARAVGMTAEDEARQANESRLASARFAESDAKKALEAMPNDPDLQTAYNVAIRETEKVASEIAKWERDTARSKGDAVKSASASNQAAQAELKGQTFVAALIRQRVTNELAIVSAQRSGNKELESQLRISGDLERKELARRRVMDGDRVMRPAEIRSRERREEINARLADRVSSRFSDPDRITTATVGRTPRAKKILGSQSSLTPNGIDGSRGDTDFSTVFMSGGVDLLRDKRWGRDEMDYKKRVADIGATRAQKQDALAKQQEDRLQSGRATPEEALGKIAQILDGWNKK
jgi:hypothetical protein